MALLSKEGWETSPEYLSAVDQIARPTTLRQLRGLVGLLNWMRFFIPDFSKEAQPILKLLKVKNVRQEWKSEQEMCLQRMKQLLKSSSVLAHPNFQEPFIVYTDASEQAIGGVLC